MRSTCRLMLLFRNEIIFCGLKRVLPSLAVLLRSIFMFVYVYCVYLKTKNLLKMHFTSSNPPRSAQICTPGWQRV